MRRLTLALFTALTLSFGMSLSASAQDDPDCEDYATQEDAQAVYNQDTSDPFGLDGPIGPNNDTRGTPGLACEGRPSGGGGGSSNEGVVSEEVTEDTTSEEAAVESAAAAEVTEDTSAVEVTEDTSSEDANSVGASDLPDTGTGPAIDGSGNTLLVTALAGFASLLGFSALRLRRQA